MPGEIKPQRVPKKAVPDGGYGWVIVFGAALTHFLLVGMARSLGVLYLILLDKFGGSASATALVIALFNTCRTITAPIISILVEKFGGRIVAIIGSLILCVGLCISAFAMNLWFLYATFGFLSGFGGTMVFVPAYIMVGKYFNKHKGKAMALATIGSGLGNIFFGPFINVLFDKYGLFGALILLGGCMLHNAIAGCLYRPLPTAAKVTELNVDTKTTTELTDFGKGYGKDSDEDEGIETAGKASTVNDSGGIPKESGDHVKESATEIDPGHVSHSNSTENHKSGCVQKYCKPGSLMRNWTFYLYGYLVISMQTCIMTFLIFLPEFCTELGVDRHTAAYTLTIFGACDMVGRFLFGFLFDLRAIRQNRRDFYCFVAFMFGASVTAMGVMPNFVACCILTGVIAVFEGATHSQRATIVSEIVLPAQMSTAVGVVIFCQGVGNIYGPPLSGYFKDQWGSSRYGFVYCGMLLVTASIMFLVESFLCKTCRSRRWQRVSQTER